MVNCLIQEWNHHSRNNNISSPVTIFFGGGTPSLMDCEHVGEIISKICSTSDVEVSLEANPGDVIGKVSELKTAGVTRLSVGVQALNDQELIFLNRDHNTQQAVISLEQSLKHFPTTTSADLIFGRPGQTVEILESELMMLMKLGLPHVSLYQLTVERGTRLFDQVRSGEVVMPDEDTMAALYSAADNILSSHALTRYEVSNWSVPGSECQHNLGLYQS